MLVQTTGNFPAGMASSLMITMGLTFKEKVGPIKAREFSAKADSVTLTPFPESRNQGVRIQGFPAMTGPGLRGRLKNEV